MLETNIKAPDRSIEIKIKAISFLKVQIKLWIVVSDF